MEADIKPIEIALVLLAELLFGIGYNSLVAWAMKHKLTHVSITVVVGVAITLLIPAVKWFAYEMPFYQAGIFLMLCFSASGLPMVVGSMLRTVKDQKKRRPLGNAAARIRDEAVMEVNAIIHDFVERTKDNLTAGDLVELLHRLYSVVGMLRSL